MFALTGWNLSSISAEVLKLFGREIIAIKDTHQAPKDDSGKQQVKETKPAKKSSELAQAGGTPDRKSSNAPSPRPSPAIVETPKSTGAFINQLTALPDSSRQNLSPSQQNIIHETFRSGLPLVKRAVEDHERLHRDSSSYSRSTSTESVKSLREVLTAYDMHKGFLANYASSSNIIKAYEPYIARARAIVKNARS